jgi:hypothetical protein
MRLLAIALLIALPTAAAERGDAVANNFPATCSEVRPTVMNLISLLDDAPMKPPAGSPDTLLMYRSGKTGAVMYMIKPTPAHTCVVSIVDFAATAEKATELSRKRLDLLGKLLKKR